MPDSDALELSFDLDERTCPLEAVQRALYAMTDRVYGRVERADGGRLRVAMALKAGARPAVARALKREFDGLLSHQLLRRDAARANDALGEYIVTKGLLEGEAGACGVSTAAPAPRSNSRPDPAPAQTGPFRFRKVGAKTLITNDLGRHHLLGEDDFRLFVGGKLACGSALYARLKADGFIRDQMDFKSMASAWARRNRFLRQGPGLHVIVTTLRCNHRCLYCHASAVKMSDASTDMTQETARMVVDRIFESPSPSLTIEFQGGEPMANWPVVKFVVEYAQKKNKTAGKSLWLSLVSNLSLMDERKLDWLLKRDVHFCTSLDGPADLHDRNRPWSAGASHARTAEWFKRIDARTRGKAFRIDALVTVTRYSLSRARDIVDEYVRLGARGLFLRPLNPYGMAAATWSKIGYGPDEFLVFYAEALDRALEHNRKRGPRRPFAEQTARIYLAKILSDDDPNFLDLRSPCGAGIGQMAYDWDGSIFTCDEGRMLKRMGDDSFLIGKCGQGSYAESAGHPVVRAIALASSLDNQVECSQCAYKPYCGVCPIQCHQEQGDIAGRMPTNTRCRISKGVLDLLFERLQDKTNERIFRSWLKTP